MRNVSETKLMEPFSDEGRLNILEEAGVFASNPSAFPGLSSQLDPTLDLDSSFRPVGYDTRRTTGEMVHCSICAQRQEHYDGAIVRLQDGRIGLVGNSCGKRHFFGDNGWGAITNRIRQDEEQAIFLARFGPAKENLAAVDELLGKWANKLRGVEAVRNRFESEMPKLFEAICKQVRTGFLSVDQEQQVPFRKFNGDIEMRTEIQQVKICRLEADWFFLGDDLARTIDRLRPQLTEAGGYLRADANAHNVSGVKRLMKVCRDSLQVVAQKQVQLKSLAADNTVTQIANWGNLSQKGSDGYEAQSRVLLRVREGSILGSVDLGSFPADIERHWTDVLASWPSL